MFANSGAGRTKTLIHEWPYSGEKNDMEEDGRIKHKRSMYVKILDGQAK